MFVHVDREPQGRLDLSNWASSLNKVIITIIILAQAVLEIFCSEGPLWVECLSLKRGIIQSNFDRILWKVNLSGHLHHAPKLYARYHDPSSSSSPDILFTRSLYYTKCQSQKREIIQSNICSILSKVNQVIYIMDTICEPNIMIHRLTMGKSKKRRKWTITLQRQVWRKRKKYVSTYFSYLLHISNFKILSLTILDCMQA